MCRKDICEQIMSQPKCAFCLEKMDEIVSDSTYIGPLAYSMHLQAKRICCDSQRKQHSSSSKNLARVHFWRRKRQQPACLPQLTAILATFACLVSCKIIIIGLSGQLTPTQHSQKNQDRYQGTRYSKVEIWIQVLPPSYNNVPEVCMDKKIVKYSNSIYKVSM